MKTNLCGSIFFKHLRFEGSFFNHLIQVYSPIFLCNGLMATQLFLNIQYQLLPNPITTVINTQQFTLFMDFHKIWLSLPDHPTLLDYVKMHIVLQDSGGRQVCCEHVLLPKT